MEIVQPYNDIDNDNFVQSVSGSIVDNTDPQNPVVNGVPLTRTITINGNTEDLSSDANFTIPTGDANAWHFDGDTLGAKKTIGSKDNQDIGIITNNLERLTVLKTGEVGIGTNNPQAKLDVVVASGQPFRLYNTGNNGLFNIYTGGGNIQMNSAWSQGSISFAGGGNIDQVLIDKDGKMGIGITSPTEKLDVSGNINIPTTTSSVGIIKQNGSRFIHSFYKTDDSNVFIGKNSGNLTLTGNLYDKNTGIGANTLSSLTTGYYNVAIGYNSLNLATTGYQNLGIGLGTLANITTGYDNVAIGALAMQFGTGAGSIAIGSASMRNQLNAYQNVAIGLGAIAGSSSYSEYNVAIGVNALNSLTTGTRNSAVGRSCLSSLTTAGNTTGLGMFAGYSSNASNGVFLGYGAGFYETGANKLFIDNQTRASEADGRAKALIYGVFDATASNQKLTINAKLNVSQLPTSSTGLSTGDIWVDTTGGLNILKII